MIAPIANSWSLRRKAKGKTYRQNMSTWIVGPARVSTMTNRLHNNSRKAKGLKRKGGMVKTAQSLTRTTKGPNRCNWTINHAIVFTGFCSNSDFSALVLPRQRRSI